MLVQVTPKIIDYYTLRHVEQLNLLQVTDLRSEVWVDESETKRGIV